MIRFMRYKLLYLIISGFVILPGLYSLLTFGLKPSIDFTGGSRLELSLKGRQEKEASASAKTAEASVSASPDSNWVGKVKNYFEDNKIEYENISLDNGALVIRLKEISEARKNELVAKLSQSVTPFKEKRFETLGPLLGRELIYKTIIGVILAYSFITFYITYQFKDRLFGLSAILATLHDSLVILGIFSWLGKFWGVEVDTLFVTAVLTTLSFSVHDTIVVYDRIREKIKNLGVKMSDLSVLDLETVIDSATNETLVRSLNNSLTVVFMLTALFVLGGQTIRWFALALLIGTISGTYSSPFVAGPFLILFKKFNDSRKKHEA